MTILLQTLIMNMPAVSPPDLRHYVALGVPQWLLSLVPLVPHRFISGEVDRILGRSCIEASTGLQARGRGIGTGEPVISGTTFPSGRSTGDICGIRVVFSHSQSFCFIFHPTIITTIPCSTITIVPEIISCQDCPDLDTHNVCTGNL